DVTTTNGAITITPGSGSLSSSTEGVLRFSVEGELREGFPVASDAATGGAPNSDGGTDATGGVDGEAGGSVNAKTGGSVNATTGGSVNATTGGSANGATGGSAANAPVTRANEGGADTASDAGPTSQGAGGTAGGMPLVAGAAGDNAEGVARSRDEGGCGCLAAGARTQSWWTMVLALCGTLLGRVRRLRTRLDLRSATP
ncbi:MAG: hypothetical protein JW940_31860, partial [Polyangiaceae bacterium]|nr:hypothetical protein [Polyangiaceae bacterium]